ncbi:MAG: ABC transporter permease subunit [Clostridiales bacterium]|nr:ABC transporter permease subunit [Clostridiales bacterium]
MLFTLIRNELVKMFKKGKTWIVFILFALFMGFMMYGAKVDSDNMGYYSSVDGQIESLERSIEYEKEIINNNKKEGIDKSELEISIQNSQKQIDRLKSIADKKDEPDFWKEQIRIEKEQLQSQIDMENSTGEYDSYAKNRIKEIDEALESGIEPVEEWVFNAVNFSNNFINIIGTVILAVGIAVFMSDIVSGESTPPTLKFLLVQPISRGKVLLSKFIATIITVVGLIGGLELLAYGILGLFTGFDSGKIPTTIGIKYKWDYTNIEQMGTPQLITVDGSGISSTRGELFLSSFALQILFIITCCAFIFLISSIFKSSMVTMAISVIVSVATTIISAASSTVQKVAHLIFFNYGDTKNVIVGGVAEMYRNINFSPYTGIIVMLVTTVICYVIAHIVFSKKDMLI